MLKPRRVKISILLCSQPFVFSFASRIQPTAHSVGLQYIFIEKKSQYKQSCPVQTFVVQGPLCFFREGLGSQLSKKIQRIPTDFSLSFPCGSASKESACNAGDLGSIPGWGRSPGERKGCPLQYSYLENSMDYIVHGVAKNRTQLSDFHSSVHCHPQFIFLMQEP